MDRTKKLINEVAMFLEQEIYDNGAIQPGNKAIWDNYLNAWDNETWNDIFNVLLTEIDNHPQDFKQSQITQITKAKLAFLNSRKTSLHCMNLKENKKHAWGMLMLLREVDPLIPMKNDYTELGHEESSPIKNLKERREKRDKEEQPFKVVEYYADRIVITEYKKSNEN